jgi:hypothetical protein
MADKPNRELGQMSEVEKSQHRNFTAVLNNPLATPQEKTNARQRVDALEWKGQTGPLMEKITKLTARLDHVEETGQSMSEEDRAALVELRKLAKRLDGAKLDTLEEMVNTCQVMIAELAVTEQQHHNDNQVGWSKHDQALAQASAARRDLSEQLNKVTELSNEKFRKVEKAIEDLVADAIDAAETAIMAEAQDAVKTAVANLMGDVTTPPSTDAETDKIEF